MGTYGKVKVARLLGFAVGAAVVRSNAPAVGGASCAEDPRVLDGSTMQEMVQASVGVFEAGWRFAMEANRRTFCWQEGA